MNAAIGKHKFCGYVGSVYNSLEAVEKVVETIKKYSSPTGTMIIKEFEL